MTDIGRALESDRVVLSGATFNTISAAVRQATERQAGSALGSDRWRRQTGIALVKNASGATVGRFGILGIDDVLYEPTADDDDPQTQTFKNQLPLVGKTPDADKHKGRFVILLAPAVAGEIVPAVACGVVCCKVRTDSDDAQFADVLDGDAGKLQAASAGSAQILWLEGGTSSERWAVVRIGNPSSGGGVHYGKIKEGGGSDQGNLYVEVEECSWRSNELDPPAPNARTWRVYVCNVSEVGDDIVHRKDVYLPEGAVVAFVDSGHAEDVGNPPVSVPCGELLHKVKLFYAKARYPSWDAQDWDCADADIYVDWQCEHKIVDDAQVKLPMYGLAGLPVVVEDQVLPCVYDGEADEWRCLACTRQETFWFWPTDDWQSDGGEGVFSTTATLYADRGRTREIATDMTISLPAYSRGHVPLVPKGDEDHNDKPYPCQWDADVGMFVCTVNTCDYCVGAKKHWPYGVDVPRGWEDYDEDDGYLLVGADGTDDGVTHEAEKYDSDDSQAGLATTNGPGNVNINVQGGQTGPPSSNITVVSTQEGSGVADAEHVHDTPGGSATVPEHEHTVPAHSHGVTTQADKLKRIGLRLIVRVH